jgi:hypothetical protein
MASSSTSLCPAPPHDALMIGTPRAAAKSMASARPASFSQLTLFENARSAMIVTPGATPTTPLPSSEAAIVPATCVP